MIMYSTKNYTDNEGARTVIGGELVILPGAKVTGLAAKAVPDSKAGAVEELVADYNRLLAALRSAGLVGGRG